MFMPRFKLKDYLSLFSLSGCSATFHLLDHRHFHILDVVVVGQIEVPGHGETSSVIVGIMVISLHRPKVFTKTVSKFRASFSHVQHLTSLAKDRIDHAGGSTIQPPIEVNSSAGGSDSISLRREVTGATPGSVARKCSWWCLVLLRAGDKGTMDQDVTETSFPPMDTQKLVVKYVRKGWVFSQNAEIEDYRLHYLCTILYALTTTTKTNKQKQVLQFKYIGMISELKNDINIQVRISVRFYTSANSKGLKLREIFENSLFSFWPVRSQSIF